MRTVIDIVGIGFGPSNLALAAAIQESQDKNISALFLEQQEDFSWHKEMLLNDTEMQISFLKDIATLRNPSSNFTFLNYLHEENRLSSFINLKNFHPSRVEFNQYFRWVAGKLKNYVKYSAKVIDVRPYGACPYNILKIIFWDENKKCRDYVLARNIVVATGGTPNIPHFIKHKEDSMNIWHTSDYLKKIKNYKNTGKSYHFCVVGSGQSSAEIVYDLATNYPNSKVTCVHRGFGYKPADESQFSNEIFDSKFVDLFYSSSSELQNNILSEHADTNYSVVDIELIQKLYRMKYEESIIKKNRLEFMRFSSLVGAKEKQNQVDVTIKNLMHNDKLEFPVDAIILATGYRYSNPPHILNYLSNYFKYQSNKNVEITRNYRIVSVAKLRTGIYMQGCNENTHGLTDTLLSLGAVRAAEILNDLISRKAIDNVDLIPNQDAAYG